MNRWSGVFNSLVLFLALIAQGREVAALSITYDQTITTPKSTSTARVQMRDDYVRVETTSQEMTYVIIQTPSGTYSYAPDKQIALKLPDTMQVIDLVGNVAHYEELLQESQAVQIGSETIQGYPCDIYQFEDPVQKATATAWVWTVQGFPLRIEMELPGGKTVTELTNIIVDADIPDSVFELPEGVTVFDPDNVSSMFPLEGMQESSGLEESSPSPK